MIIHVNDLEGIVKLVRSLMCYLKCIKKTVFKVSQSIWWKPHVSISFGSGEVWTIIEKPDLTILEWWRETLYTYDVIATILNVVDFQFWNGHKRRKLKLVVKTPCQRVVRTNFRQKFKMDFWWTLNWHCKSDIFWKITNYGVMAVILESLWKRKQRKITRDTHMLLHNY